MWTVLWDALGVSVDQLVSGTDLLESSSPAEDQSRPYLIIALDNDGNFKHWDRRDIFHSCIRLAKLLRLRGIKKGDVVGISIGNCMEFLVAFLSVTHLGASAAPQNPAATSEELWSALTDLNCKILLTLPNGPAAPEGMRVFRFSTPRPGQLSAKTAKGRPERVPKLTEDFLNEMGASRASPDDVALLLRTSGTTGKPKTVPLSHKNLVASLRNIVSTYKLNCDDAAYLVMPLFHVHGLVAGCLAPMASDGALVMPPAFSVRRFWSDVHRWTPTWITVVPTMLQFLSKSGWPEQPPKKLRFVRTCSSALSMTLLKEVEEALKVPVLQAYGMTEAAHQIASNPLPSVGKAKPGSVGIPQGVSQACVMDDLGVMVANGVPGEICVRGANVFDGYLNNSMANHMSFYEGHWFRTGDQGIIDDDGYIFITGRIKELINRGGEKISPVELDEVLLRHPAVADVVAFPAPDPDYGEVPGVAVVVESGFEAGDALKEEICTWLAEEQKLSKYKIPKYFFWTDSIKRTASGKVQRNATLKQFMHTELKEPENYLEIVEDLV